MELQSGSLIGDIEDDVLDLVEVAQGVDGIVFFEIAATDAHPDGGLLIISHAATLAGVEDNSLEGLGGVCEVIFGLVGGCEAELEVGVLLLIRDNFWGQELRDSLDITISLEIERLSNISEGLASVLQICSTSL